MSRLLALWPRILALAIFANLALLMGCGGSAGVDNGTIIGKVFSNLRDRSAVRLPEGGVTVVAQRESGSPQIIRTTVTDANGVFSFPDLPTGAYVIGFAKEGFQTIDTQSGATSQRTAVGSQVRVFIDSGRTSVAPDVTMRALFPSGDVTLIVTVRDITTGQPITDATVTASTLSQSQNQNGVYTLNVPILRTNDDVFGSIRIITVIARAAGFRPFTGDGNTDPQIRVLPGETQRLTINLTPLSQQDSGAIAITGSYRFSKFQNLLARTPGIRLSVRDLSDTLLNDVTARINPADGTWQISGLPPSTPTISRQFNFVFEHPNIHTFVLQRVLMPQTGTKTIVDPVILQPVTVDVIGSRNLSEDNGVTVFQPDGAEDYAQIIMETGGGPSILKVSVVNGQFLIPDVPVRNSPEDNAWVLRVVVSSSLKKTGCLTFRCEDLEIRPVSPVPAQPANCPTCVRPVFDTGLVTCKICDP
jgi:hypothetical protein